jgi:large subunit ribosomal protein L29
MNMSDIEKLDNSAITKKIDDLRVELFELKFQKHTSGIQKPHLLKEIKKNIARLNTALNSKKNTK